MSPPDGYLRVEIQQVAVDDAVAVHVGPGTDVLVDRTLRRVGVGIDAVDRRARQILAHVPLDRRLAGAEQVPRHAPPRGEVVVGDAVSVGRAVTALPGRRAADLNGHIWLARALRQCTFPGSGSSHGRSGSRRST